MTIKKMLGFPQNLKSSFVLHVTAFMENLVAFNEQVHKLKWLKSQKSPPSKKIAKTLLLGHLTQISFKQ